MSHHTVRQYYRISSEATDGTQRLSPDLTLVSLSPGFPLKAFITSADVLYRLLFSSYQTQHFGEALSTLQPSGRSVSCIRSLYPTPRPNRVFRSAIVQCSTTTYVVHCMYVQRFSKFLQQANAKRQATIDYARPHPLC